MRRPDIARAITSCWISLVPSKIVWLTFSGFPGAPWCRGVLVTWCFTDGRFHLVSSFPLVSRSKTRDLDDFSHFNFATSASHRKAA